MRFHLLLIPAILASVLGCEDQSRPNAVPAGGKVMFQKSTPAEGAMVVFHPTNYDTEKRIGGKPFATVEADGSFSLTTFEKGDGAPEGEYGVTIEWRGKPRATSGKFKFGSDDDDAENRTGGGKSMLNPKYGNPAKPAFTVTVTKGDPNQFTFDVN